MTSTSKPVKFYSPEEERINVRSHGFGLLLSIVGLAFLIMKSVASGDSFRIVSFAIYGMSLVLLYAASTIYHRSTIAPIRARLNVFDHAAIYVLIAGSYTPFTLVTLHGTTGWILFGVAWGSAIIGVVLKLFFTGRFNILSTVMYVLMGWIIVFAAQPLMQNMEGAGLLWLLAGGISYTIGALLYSLKGMRFNHAIFHIFVLIGSFCHFVAIYFYV